MASVFTPLHSLLSLLSQGFTWFLVGFMSGRVAHELSAGVWLPLVVVAFAAFLSVTLLLQLIVVGRADYDTSTYIRLFLDICSLPRAILLLISSLSKQSHHKDLPADLGSSLYCPLTGKSCDQDNRTDVSEDEGVSPFADVEFFSKLSFWWMNSVMRKGYEKTLEEQDIPRLSKKDRAENR